MNQSAEEIRKRMEAVRCGAADDVDEVVHAAKDMLDWRGYVRSYPWLCIGAAAAVGYLAVPRRLELISPDADTLLELAKRNKLVVKPRPAVQQSGGLAHALIGMGVKAAMHAAAAYLRGPAGEDDDG